jgi:hypothetical protein
LGTGFSQEPAVPVTAKLSRKFYEVFGDEIANELVEWFNLVDATYRWELREINELNYQRFEAKLAQRLAEFGAELRTEFRTDMGKLRGELEKHRTEMEKLRADLTTGLAGQRAELLRWMFLFWIGTVGPLLLASLL